MNEHSLRRFRFLIPFLVLGFIALFTFAVYGLWNLTLPAVLGVKAITYWQALGILVLAKILFGGMPGRGARRFGPPWRRRRFLKHWESLTPEQRERWRAEMRQRFGDWPRPPWCESDPARPDKPSDPATV